MSHTALCGGKKARTCACPDAGPLAGMCPQQSDLLDFRFSPSGQDSHSWKAQ
jgi:hypothetical protein